MTDTPRLSLDEAQARLFALATPLAIERADIAGALGRYLAEPLVARRTQPAAAQSAMDGYAVRAGDTTGPWTIVGESAAGRPYDGAIGHGEAVRIATGALMPAAAAGVIVQEDVTRDGPRAFLTGTAPAPIDRHVRARGLDFAEDDVVLQIGTRIGSAQAALAVAAGHRQLCVRARPRVVVLESGDELSAADLPGAAHQTPASNGVMLAAMFAQLPCEIRRLGPVADDLAALASALADAADADVVVTSGGASVGDHDLIRPALENLGATLAFWRVAIRPGKPLLVATRARSRTPPQIILGLPGNPVSTYVTAHLFALPLMRTLLGAADPLPIRFSATLGAPLPANAARREFLRARWDGATIMALTRQDSSVLTTLARSNALIDRAAHASAADAGAQVSAHLIENGGGA